ncbi:N-6 DNA methylase [Pannonibacter indicus]|uniref:N-6 DNA methylase n=1 Tax=Pannonibacter indicus TaxID=466044 RepID=UPI003919735C
MQGKIASAGRNGQFRTPRHIINLMVELTAPTPHDVICDSVSGTCGFLVGQGSICVTTMRRCSATAKRGGISVPAYSMATTLTAPCCASAP